MIAPTPSPISIDVGWLPVGPAVMLTIFRCKTATPWSFEEYIQLFWNPGSKICYMNL